MEWLYNSDWIWLWSLPSSSPKVLWLEPPLSPSLTYLLQSFHFTCLIPLSKLQSPSRGLGWFHNIEEYSSLRCTEVQKIWRQRNVRAGNDLVGVGVRRVSHKFEEALSIRNGGTVRVERSLADRSQKRITLKDFAYIVPIIPLHRSSQREGFSSDNESEKQRRYRKFWFGDLQKCWWLCLGFECEI